jgi:hypothetical protein
MVTIIQLSVRHQHSILDIQQWQQLAQAFFCIARPSLKSVRERDRKNYDCGWVSKAMLRGASWLLAAWTACMVQPLLRKVKATTP